MRRALSSLTVIALVATSAMAASGTTHQVTQSGKAFSEKTLSVKKGDSLVIKNDDSVVHHIFTVSDGYQFDTAQPPGSETEFAFPTSGVVDIRCAIHPDMHLQVTVD